MRDNVREPGRETEIGTGRERKTEGGSVREKHKKREREREREGEDG